MVVSSKSFDPVYVSKDKTVVVLEEVALHTVNPSVLALAQYVATECYKKSCGSRCKMSGTSLLCEVMELRILIHIPAKKGSQF